MKKFDIPDFYISPLISAIKANRKNTDRLKNDFTPTIVDFGKVQFHLARHFGFCYGVENAIEIVYKTLADYPNKRIFLLSEMIHNQLVNKDLEDNGISFLMDTSGNQLISWDELSSDDIVVIPAFGTTVEILNTLKKIGVDTVSYNTTCPFVEKVWKRAAKLGKDKYTIIIHGKANHEETRATFSHSQQNSPAVVVQNIEEAKELTKYITGEKAPDNFYTEFEGKYSDGFDINEDLKYVGVVNQTTMLATDTQEIADYIKSVTIKVFGEENFADTRDTLCYATSDNQKAVYGMLKSDADFAIVVGGYNSSNTSHLVELCEKELTTFHIADVDEIQNNGSIRHFRFRDKTFETTTSFLPQKDPVKILITSGASCPDAVVEQVMDKVSQLILKEEASTKKTALLKQF